MSQVSNYYFSNSKHTVGGKSIETQQLYEIIGIAMMGFDNDDRTPYEFTLLLMKNILSSYVTLMYLLHTFTWRFYENERPPEAVAVQLVAKIGSMNVYGSLLWQRVYIKTTVCCQVQTSSSSHTHTHKNTNTHTHTHTRRVRYFSFSFI